MGVDEQHVPLAFRAAAAAAAVFAAMVWNVPLKATTSQQSLSFSFAISQRESKGDGSKKRWWRRRNCPDLIQIVYI